MNFAYVSHYHALKDDPSKLVNACLSLVSGVDPYISSSLDQ